MSRYFLRLDGVDDEWREVTKEQYVYAERAAGFHSKFGPNEPATAYFSNGAIEGRYDESLDDVRRLLGANTPQPEGSSGD